jgi:hypothetical protein
MAMKKFSWLQQIEKKVRDITLIVIMCLVFIACQAPSDPVITPVLDPITIDEMKFCETESDCIPVGCKCDCSGCGGFDYEEVVNKEYVDQWYLDQGCVPTSICLEECCPGREVACQNQRCLVIELGWDQPDKGETSSRFDYQVGLGYGFLGKEVRIIVDNVEVLNMIGTDDIETHAQLLGTKMLASGSSPKEEITIKIIVNEVEIHQGVIDLSEGLYVHINFEESGLKVYNTPYLIHE